MKIQLNLSGIIFLITIYKGYKCNVISQESFFTAEPIS